MPSAYHILINGLSIGSGGGFTVGRELWRHLAREREDWTITIAVIGDHPLHAQMSLEGMPGNCRVHRAPPQAVNRLARARYEATGLRDWARANDVHAVVQLNGMIVPQLRLPTLSHNQDPWPYRPEAWSGLKDRVVAAFKRRAHAKALREAACVGWTSGYLRDLVCGHWHIKPRCSEVFYNGIPDDWIHRARQSANGWDDRPMDLVTVSNVAPYKRQDLVIRALPGLVARRGLEKLNYRILGHCSPEYAEELWQLAASLGVGERVHVEGRVSDARVQEALSSARCFVLMSVCESFGIPAIEAMSFGTPVVTSDCCAIPEVCGNAAELCPVDDVNALAAKIAHVLLDTEHAQRLQRLGVERVEQYSWRETARKMAATLERIATPTQAGAVAVEHTSEA